MNPRTISTGACYIALVMVIVSGWLLYNITSSMSIGRAMRQTVVDALTIELALRDAESGQRGYIITDDPGYLRPYNAGLHDYQIASNALVAVTNTDPELSNLTQTMLPMAGQKLAELAQTLAMRDTSFDAARQAVLTHLGQDLMESVTSKLDMITLKANQKLDAVIDNLRIYVRVCYLSVMAMLVSLVIGVSGILIGIGRR